MKTQWKLVALTLVVCSAAQAGDFVDTRLSFVFADDNVLAKSGETTPNSPTAGFGAGNQNTLFFDNFNTKFTGFESLSNLTLYKKSPSFFEGFTAEAALSVLLLVRPAGTIDFRDNSSYVRLNWTPSGWGEREGVSFTGFPVSADRFRLGYAYKISWGGSDIFTPNAQNDGVPGARIQITRDTWYAFAGMKTGLLLNDVINEKERVYGGMAGFGIDVTPFLRIEAGGGYFQKGNVPGLQGIVAPVNSAGGSAEIVFHKGAPVGTSIDFRLYRNDPEVFEKFFAPEQYPGGLAVTVSAEGSYLTQTLASPDVFAKTQFQSAQAIALQARLKYNFMRISFLGLYRSLSFIQFNVPSLTPFKDFPAGSTLTPEAFGAIGFDWHFPALHFTPGIIGGVQLPATFKAPSTVLGGNTPPAGLTGSRTLVVRDVNQFAILPTNTSARPIVSVKLNFRLDISDYFAAIGEAYYTYDNNRTTFKDSVSGIAEPSFEKPHAVGFNAIVQARF
ncbi:MAG: hypothetical protein IPJ65_18220 [Archangiaceae bacterium]|nr:hypothetical protein [Archangiaceae bacterium]